MPETGRDVRGWRFGRAEKGEHFVDLNTTMGWATPICPPKQQCKPDHDLSMDWASSQDPIMQGLEGLWMGSQSPDGSDQRLLLETGMVGVGWLALYWVCLGPQGRVVVV